MKRSRKRSKNKSKCRTYLSSKIKKNMGEYHMGVYDSRSQAIAVSYSQVRKKHPACKRILSKSKRLTRSKKRRSLR